MIDSNQNITRKFDLNRKKIKLKIDFDSSLTCYSLDPKSIKIFTRPNDHLVGQDNTDQM
jgi:hypothetical protein